jgi:hypothetical protein
MRHTKDFSILHNECQYFSYYIFYKLQLLQTKITQSGRRLALGWMTGVQFPVGAQIFSLSPCQDQL